MEDTYGIQSRIGSIIVVERWYCCRGSPVFSDRNIQKGLIGSREKYILGIGWWNLRLGMQWQ